MGTGRTVGPNSERPGEQPDPMSSKDLGIIIDSGGPCAVLLLPTLEQNIERHARFPGRESLFNKQNYYILVYRYFYIELD